MNSENLARKLIEAARADKPSERVPYAFAKRVTARLSARPALDLSADWARALWRAAVPCIAIPMLLGFWAASPAKGPTQDTSLAQAFEETLFASVEQQVGEFEEQ
jgi:hypothetical protein